MLLLYWTTYLSPLWKEMRRFSWKIRECCMLLFKGHKALPLIKGEVWWSCQVRYICFFILTVESEHKYVFEYGISVKSERDANYTALDMIKKININLRSVRFDRYYLAQNILEDFNENKIIFIIPNKNSRIRGRRKWRYIIWYFTDDPPNYLREHFKNNASELWLTSDNRTAGNLIY